MKRFQSMHRIHQAMAIGFTLLLTSVQAQDCSNPVPTCGDVPEAISLNYAQNLDFGCLNAPYVTVLEFTTNAKRDQHRSCLSGNLAAWLAKPTA